jgi:hypothetical protein
VVDVEHPEEVGPIEERCRAQRVEPLLDDRRPDAFAAMAAFGSDRAGISRMLLR